MVFTYSLNIALKPWYSLRMSMVSFFIASNCLCRVLKRLERVLIAVFSLCLWRNLNCHCKNNVTKDVPRTKTKDVLRQLKNFWLHLSQESLMASYQCESNHFIFRNLCKYTDKTRAESFHCWIPQWILGAGKIFTQMLRNKILKIKYNHHVIISTSVQRNFVIWNFLVYLSFFFLI